MLHWSARAPCLHGRLSSNVRPQIAALLSASAVNSRCAPSSSIAVFSASVRQVERTTSKEWHGFSGAEPHRSRGSFLGQNRSAGAHLRERESCVQSVRRARRRRKTVEPSNHVLVRGRGNGRGRSTSRPVCEARRVGLAAGGRPSPLPSRSGRRKWSRLRLLHELGRVPGKKLGPAGVPRAFCSESEAEA